MIILTLNTILFFFFIRLPFPLVPFVLTDLLLLQYYLHLHFSFELTLPRPPLLFLNLALYPSQSTHPTKTAHAQTELHKAPAHSSQTPPAVAGIDELMSMQTAGI